MSVGGFVYIFGQGLSSQGLIVISAAPESQVGFNYFCVTRIYIIYVPESCRMTEKCSRFDFYVLMSKQVGSLW